MPFFDLKCDSCGHIFERLLQGSNIKIGEACPSCGLGPVRKIVPMVDVGKGFSFPKRGALLSKDMKKKNERLKKRAHQKKLDGEKVHRRANLVEV